MKLQKKEIISLLSLLCIFILFLPIFLQIESHFNNTENGHNAVNDDLQINDINNVKKSEYWDENDVPFIHITGANWTLTNDTYDWCNGKGTKTEPYVIENVTVNGNNSRNGILIEDSDVYFIITNVKVYNSKSGNNYAGIKLDNTTNGILTNNNLSFNLRSGIFLTSSDNNIIEGNTINNNDLGIYLYDSNYNNISGNIINDNINYGIYLWDSNYNNTISRNVVNNNVYGIYLRLSDKNTVSGNIITNSFTFGIRMLMANLNIFKENIIADNPGFGIYISDIPMSFNNLFFNNAFTNNGEHAYDPHDNFWNNSAIGNFWDDYTGIDFNSDGIGDEPYYISGGGIDYLPIAIIWGPVIIDDNGGGDFTWAQAAERDWCEGTGTQADPYIIKNSIHNGYNSSSSLIIRDSNVFFSIENSKFYNSGDNHYDAGIYLYNVTNGNLLNNDISFNNGHGIYLELSNNNQIIGNIVNNNSGNGIILEFSNNNIITGNTVKYNTLSGIVLISSYNNTISGNNETINNNGLYGIYLDSSHINDIIDNVINFNQIGIYLYESNYNNIIDNNLLDNGDAIVEINCYGNKFINNQGYTSTGFLGITGGDDNDDDSKDNDDDSKENNEFTNIIIFMFVIGSMNVMSLGGLYTIKKKKMKVNAISGESEIEEKITPLRFVVPLREFLSEREVYIHKRTRGIPFEKLHPVFQRIMRDEFIG